ncbi:ribosomal maturation YjgA family protein [Methylorubrum populi]
MPDLRTRRLPLLLATAAVIAAGLAIRLAPLGWPPMVVKYAGSTLWGAMVYGLVAFLRPAAETRRLVAVAVELFRLVHAPWLDAFRLTLPGQLLLGRIFSVWNLLAYAAGIAAAAGLDAAARRA